MNWDNWYKVETDPIYSWLIENAVVIKIDFSLFE
jgi:hypothetical protein